MFLVTCIPTADRMKSLRLEPKDRIRDYALWRAFSMLPCCVVYPSGCTPLHTEQLAMQTSHFAKLIINRVQVTLMMLSSLKQEKKIKDFSKIRHSGKEIKRSWNPQRTVSWISIIYKFENNNENYDALQWHRTISHTYFVCDSHNILVTI